MAINMETKITSLSSQEEKLLKQLRELEFGKLIIVKESSKIVHVIQEKSIKL